MACFTTLISVCVCEEREKAKQSWSSSFVKTAFSAKDHSLSHFVLLYVGDIHNCSHSGPLLIAIVACLLLDCPLACPNGQPGVRCAMHFTLNNSHLIYCSLPVELANSQSAQKLNSSSWQEDGTLA